MIQKIVNLLAIELALVSIKIDKLSLFQDSDFYAGLEQTEKDLFDYQKTGMLQYKKGLEDRIKFYCDRDGVTPDGSDKGTSIIGSFNPNGNQSVEEIKFSAKSLINLIDADVDKVDGCQRRKAVAITDIEKAQMMAVKALFS